MIRHSSKRFISKQLYALRPSILTTVQKQNFYNQINESGEIRHIKCSYIKNE